MVKRNIPIALIVGLTSVLLGCKSTNSNPQAFHLETEASVSKVSLPEQLNEGEMFTVDLESGSLKDQLDDLLKTYLPKKEVVWDQYKGNHEWVGQSTISRPTLHELLDVILSSYGAPPKGPRCEIKANAVIFYFQHNEGK